MSTTTNNPPQLLADLLNARTPSGSEQEAHKVLDKHLKPAADLYEKDTLGNRIATLNPKGNPKLMLAGHMDELGLMINYIDPKGYLHFDTIGGHDTSLIPGRRVTILTAKGPIHGVTGKRAIHLTPPQERKEISELHNIWIDIGVNSEKETKGVVSIGDPVVYDMSFQMLRKNRITGRALDNKTGCYVVSEVLRRLSKKKKTLKSSVISVATTQEEIGVRGVVPSAFSVNPHMAIAVDVTHATDHPTCQHTKHGKIELGKGPVLSKGPNINPVILDILLACAKKHKISIQMEANPKPASNDARSLQIARAGVATGIVSLPLRYMHTPSEVMDLADIENAVKLICAFAVFLNEGNTGIW